MHQACEHNLIPLLRLLSVPLSYSRPSTPFDSVHLIFFPVMTLEKQLCAFNAWRFTTGKFYGVFSF